MVKFISIRFDRFALVLPTQSLYIYIYIFFPQQRKLMGSSAQNSSGVDSGSTRSRRRFLRFRRRSGRLVQSGQVQQGSGVPEKVWEALVQSQARFRRRFRRRSAWEALVQSQVRFNSGSGVPEKVWEALVYRARSGSTGFWRRFR